MQSNWWLTTIWVVGTLLNAGTAFAIVRRGLLRRWPSLFAYSILSLAFDAGLIVTKHQYGQFFYVYWSWMILSSLLRLWVLSDVINSFPGAALVSGRLRAVVAVAAAVIAGGAWYAALAQGTKFYLRIQSCALLMNRSVAFATAAFIAAWLVAIWLFRLGWDPTGARVAQGLAVRICGWLVSSYILSMIVNHPARLLGQGVEALAACISLGCWFYAVAVGNRALQNADELERVLAAETEDAPAHLRKLAS